MATPNFAEAVRRSKKLIASGLTTQFAPTADGQNMMVAMDIPSTRLVLGANMIRKNPSELIAWASREA